MPPPKPRRPSGQHRAGPQGLVHFAGETSYGTYFKPGTFAPKPRTPRPVGRRRPDGSYAREEQG
jgi:hypothetical protein